MQRDPQSPKIARTDDDVAGRNQRFPRFHRIAFRQHYGVARIASERYGVGHSSLQHAGKRFDFLQEPAGKGAPLRVISVSIGRQGQRAGQDLPGHKPGIDRKNFAEAGKEQPGSNEQDQGKRDLRCGQQCADEADTPPAGDAFLVQYLARVELQRVCHRNRAYEKADHRCQTENEENHRAVHGDLASSRNLLEPETAQGLQTPVAENQSEQRARDREEQGLGEQLPRNPPAACTERKAHGQLLPPRASARHH